MIDFEFDIIELRKKHYPFLTHDNDIFKYEYSRILYESIKNYLDEVGNSINSFIEKNGNTEDLIDIRDWEIKHNLSID